MERPAPDLPKISRDRQGPAFRSIDGISSITRARNALFTLTVLWRASVNAFLVYCF